MSYRKSHIKGKIKKLKPKKLLYKKLWFWILILVAILSSAGIYLVLFYSGTQISNVMISGNQKVPKENIHNLVESAINHKFLSFGNWIVSSKSFFLVDSNDLRMDLLKQFPEIATANVSREFFQTVDIKISEKQAVAVLCQESDCYMIDGEGIAFEKTEEAVFLIVRQNSGENGRQNVAIGQKALDKNVIVLLEKAQKMLQEKFQITLKTAQITSSLRLNAVTNENWKIYFDLKSSADSQILKLNSLLLSEISPSARKNLRYIDLRPKDRAVICDNSTCGG